MNLNTFDLSSFDTKNATNMKGMFYGCTSLINLDISSFDTKDVIKMNDLFYDFPDNIYESNMNYRIRKYFSTLSKNEIKN